MIFGEFFPHKVKNIFTWREASRMRLNPHQVRLNTETNISAEERGAWARWRDWGVGSRVGWGLRGLPIWYPISPIWYPIPLSGIPSPLSGMPSPIWYPISRIWYPTPYLVPHPINESPKWNSSLLDI